MKPATLNSNQFPLQKYYSQLQKYESPAQSPVCVRLKRNVTDLIEEGSQKAFGVKMYEQDSTNKSRLETKNNESAFNNAKYLNTEYYELRKSQSQNVNPYPENKLKLSFENISQSHLASPLNQSAIQATDPHAFSSLDQTKFMNTCKEMYGIKPHLFTTEVLAKEINKRDQFYSTVQEQFGKDTQQGMEDKLTQYFAEVKKMREIISEFQVISHLEMEDLNELYYFLKSDR